jgi:integrase
MPDGQFRPRLPTKGRERLRSCPTWEDAARLLDGALAELADGATAPSGLTLRAWGVIWLEQRELDGVRGIGTDRSRWRSHVEEAHFIDWPITSITRADVVRWLDELCSKHARPGRGQKTTAKRRISKVTVRNTFNLLRACLRKALDRELVEVNVTADVKLPRETRGVTHEPWTYLVPAEQTALLTPPPEAAALMARGEQLLVAYALGTSKRQGEIYNQKLVDVDREGRRITVRYGSEGKATKSGKIRRLPLFGIALAALEEWLPMLATRPNPHGLLWPLPSGARRQKGKPPKGWRAYLAAVGIVAETRHDGRKVRFHDLRHTGASSLVAGWWGRRWSLEEVRQLLGHSSVTVTERYAHLADSALEAAARATGGAAGDTSSERPDPPPAPPGSPMISLAAPRRLERPTNGLGNRCSIH